ncbi:Uncharacterised protein [Pandoraea pulmonicola]|uniref:Uncharacterized protein n=2 Tax=Pandoraea pulmonicola TaxID=93221 RepID=A0AAJ4ZCS9_PANPU|nr:Uncharacterised protein [Pandoraea pulmonicola]
MHKSLFRHCAIAQMRMEISAIAFAGLAMLSGFTWVHMLARTELFPPRICALAVGCPSPLIDAEAVTGCRRP